MARPPTETCRAWQLLMRFFFVQRAHLPEWGEEFGLSPVQCHVLHLIEPEQPTPMNRLAAALSCDASNVTGLVDRLESRGGVQRQAATGPPPRQSFGAAPPRGPPRQSSRADADRRATPLRLAAMYDAAAASVVAAIGEGASDAGEDSG